MGPVRADPGERMLLKILRSAPGISLWDAAKRFPFGVGTFYACLGRLEKEGLATKRRAGRQVFLYPVMDGVEVPPRARRVRRLSAAAQRVALLVLEAPDADLADLEARSGDVRRTLEHHLKNLVEGGYVTSASATRYRGLRATAKLVRETRNFDLNKS